MPDTITPISTPSATYTGHPLLYVSCVVISLNPCCEILGSPRLFILGACYTITPPSFLLSCDCLTPSPTPSSIHSFPARRSNSRESNTLTRLHRPDEFFSLLVVKRFETGNFNPQQSNRRRTRTDEAVDVAILAAVAVNPHVSTRQLEADIGIPKTSAHRILKRHTFHPYNVHLHQELHGNDVQNRVEFCQWAQHQIIANPNFFSCVLFTDESSAKTHAGFDRWTISVNGEPRVGWTPVGTPRSRSRNEGAIRATLTHTPSASSLLRARPPEATTCVRGSSFWSTMLPNNAMFATLAASSCVCHASYRLNMLLLWHLLCGYEHITNYKKTPLLPYTIQFPRKRRTGGRKQNDCLSCRSPKERGRSGEVEARVLLLHVCTHEVRTRRAVARSGQRLTFCSGRSGPSAAAGHESKWPGWVRGCRGRERQRGEDRIAEWDGGCCVLVVMATVTRRWYTPRRKPLHPCRAKFDPSEQSSSQRWPNYPRRPSERLAAVVSFSSLHVASLGESIVACERAGPGLIPTHTGIRQAGAVSAAFAGRCGLEPHPGWEIRHSVVLISGVGVGNTLGNGIGICPERGIGKPPPGVANRVRTQGLLNTRTVDQFSVQQSERKRGSRATAGQGTVAATPINIYLKYGGGRPVEPARHFILSAVRSALLLKETKSLPWLACSPPAKANRVQSPVGSLPDFRMWESCRVFLGISRFPRSCIPTLLHTRLTSPLLALKTSDILKTRIGLGCRAFCFRRQTPDGSASSRALAYSVTISPFPICTYDFAAYAKFKCRHENGLALCNGVHTKNDLLLTGWSGVSLISGYSSMREGLKRGNRGAGAVTGRLVAPCVGVARALGGALSRTHTRTGLPGVQCLLPHHPTPIPHHPPPSPPSTRLCRPLCRAMPRPASPGKYRRRFCCLQVTTPPDFLVEIVELTGIGL
ncbi:hypothetical protein PR048_001639 [Dryococelus australis]|uniref:Uncharacterized protein n=1 Tax=Dryococelus australis TaxID=614101 RepID=A0ABQ9IHW8_9NEOP|nr:hypothetical protein PR048_001639 [Dryococelus australis]